MLIWRILSYLVCYVGNIIIYIHRAHHLLFILLKTSLMVPDFTIFVDGSSCKSLFLSLFLFLDFFFQAGRKSRSTEIYCIKKRRQNEIKIERITWTAVNRNCKIWDYQPHFSIIFPLKEELAVCGSRMSTVSKVNLNIIRTRTGKTSTPTTYHLNHDFKIRKDTAKATALYSFSVIHILVP